jgi:hypothetical protein
VELRKHVVGDKSDLRRSTDKLVVSGSRSRRYEREYRCAVRRRDGYPTLAGLKARVVDQIEPELLQVESEASILISNENLNGVKPKVGIVSIYAKRRLAQPG